MAEFCWNSSLITSSKHIYLRADCSVVECPLSYEPLILDFRPAHQVSKHTAPKYGSHLTPEIYLPLETDKNAKIASLGA